jgi:hypothetical protein
MLQDEVVQVRNRNSQSRSNGVVCHAELPTSADSLQHIVVI